MKKIKIRKLMMRMDNQDGCSLMLLCDGQTALLKGKSITDALQIGILPGTTWSVSGEANADGTIVVDTVRAER